jgi:hypothetical protein
MLYPQVILLYFAMLAYRTYKLVVVERFICGELGERV